MQRRKAVIFAALMISTVNLATRFQQHIKYKKLFPANAKLFIAVSGGVDSVVLSHLCVVSGYHITLLHCNFMLRGKASNADEQFVKDLGARLQVPVRTIQFDTNTYAQQHKLSIQVAARTLRYQWFNQVMDEETGKEVSRYLLTAHHKDDDVETMLMNFFKGTGIAGLKGIPEKKDSVVRPLLFATKNELVNYAAVHELQWVEDASNAQIKYTRNYFRNLVLPLVKEQYPAAEDNLYDNLQRFKEAGVLYEQAVSIHKKKLLQAKGAEVHIPVLRLQSLQPVHTIIYEIAKPYGFTAAQTGDIAGLLQAATGKYVQSASHRILRNRNWLIIAPLQATHDVHIVIDQPGDYVFGNRVLTIKTGVKTPAAYSANKNEAYINGALLQYPLLLRKWKPGDYFYPLGMRKKKKLARFFIDLKLSAHEKEQIWVLEMNKQVVWVAGYRLDDRFKINEHTAAITYLQVR